MSRLRRGLGVLISAGAALSAVLLAPASASAASNIAVQWTTQLADPYMLQVVVSDSNGLQLTGMIVHLYAGATDVYDITDMAYTSGAPASQAWTSAAPIPQAALPPGTYTVAVDATDNNETDTGLTAPTPKPFWIGYTPTLTASANPTTLSYGETGTTISGTATGVVAGSPYTTPVPLGGVAVGLFDARTRVTTPVAMTQSDGSYSGHVELPVAGDDYQVVAASGPTWGSGSISPPLTFTWTKDPTRIVSVKVTPEDFNYGGTVPATITGTAEYDNASTGWQPLTDAPVTGGILLSGAQHTVMTDSSGHFTWQYVPSNDNRWWVEVGDGNVLGYGSAGGSVHVAVPLRGHVVHGLTQHVCPADRDQLRAGDRVRLQRAGRPSRDPVLRPTVRAMDKPRPCSAPLQLDMLRQRRVLFQRLAPRAARLCLLSRLCPADSGQRERVRQAHPAVEVHHQDQRPARVSGHRPQRRQAHGQRPPPVLLRRVAELRPAAGPDHPQAEGQQGLVLDGQGQHERLRVLHQHLHRPGQRHLVGRLQRQRHALRVRRRRLLRADQLSERDVCDGFLPSRGPN